jgi:molecular chaperone GrpE
MTSEGPEVDISAPEGEEPVGEPFGGTPQGAEGADQLLPEEARGVVAGRAEEAPGETVDQGGAAELQVQLEQLRGERDEYLDALRRLQADFENYRKRVAKQQAEQIDRAAEGLVKKLLPVFDTLDLALAHLGGVEAPGTELATQAEEEGQSPGSATAQAAEASALAQVASTLYDVLAREGLERIEAAGKPFDPTEHEAVVHEGGDGGTPEVIEVLRAGWKWRGHVLRPAMVRVKG